VFAATSGSSRVVIDGEGTLGSSPMQSLALGLAGCMGADVVTILQKGRHRVVALRITLRATRAETPPRRLIGVALSFEVTGNVPVAAVERALALSRSTYCSVWHSLRQDIELTTSFEIHP
jgi:putative redox protein